MTDVSAWAHVAAGAAAVIGGLVNAVAGGGTLITFPVLTAIGVPAVRANASNTVALMPGYMGGVVAQRSDLTGLGRTVRPQLAAAAIGGLAGSVLLIVTSEAAFRQVVPFLILTACLLMAGQDRIRTWISTPVGTHAAHPVAQTTLVGLAAVYGGYFGAGLGIMLLAVLGLFSDLPFSRLNAIKLFLAFVANLAATVFLSFSGRLEWTLIAVMAPAALLGGNLGGRVAEVVPATTMRAFVVVFGIIVAVVYFVK